MKLSKTTRAVLAEFVAVTLFVFVGCGTVVSSQWLRRPDENPTNMNDAFLTSVALAFGIGIAVLAFTTAPISGGHINPAVTFAFMLEVFLELPSFGVVPMSQAMSKFRVVEIMASIVTVYYYKSRSSL